MTQKLIPFSLIYIARRTEVVSSSAPSFNNYMGLSSMSNFDNFYGQSNFDSSSNTIIVEQKEVEVCHTEEIEIVQQRLAVIMEVAKEVILKQICEVEVQTIVLEQFSSQVSSFYGSVTHSSGSKPASYDQSISSKLGSIYSDGSLSNSNLGFNGTDVGSNSSIPTNNWNNSTSYSTVGNAKALAQQAAGNSVSSFF